MTHEEALRITRVIAAAYEQSWKPGEKAVSVYAEILAVPEIDYDIARQVFIAILRTPERFAPAAGAIYTKAEALTAERRAREIAKQLVLEAPAREDGCIDDRELAGNLEQHPEIKSMHRLSALWRLIPDTMQSLGKRSLPIENRRIASIVSEVAGRMGQPKPMTREEHEARARFLQKQAYELTANGKVAVH